MKMFESIKDQIKDIKKIVFVTGAGISQESGIHTFIGKDGLWRNHDAMKLATIDAFYDNPKFNIFLFAAIFSSITHGPKISKVSVLFCIDIVCNNPRIPTQ
jgi:NAD-dependent SIR2 family protein deacetylase